MKFDEFLMNFEEFLNNFDEFLKDFDELLKSFLNLNLKLVKGYEKLLSFKNTHLSRSEKLEPF